MFPGRIALSFLARTKSRAHIPPRYTRDPRSNNNQSSNERGHNLAGSALAWRSASSKSIELTRSLKTQLRSLCLSPSLISFFSLSPPLFHSLPPSLSLSFSLSVSPISVYLSFFHLRLFAKTGGVVATRERGALGPARERHPGEAERTGSRRWTDIRRELGIRKGQAAVTQRQFLRP